jgi:hypothetical protein
MNKARIQESAPVREQRTDSGETPVTQAQALDRVLAQVVEGQCRSALRMPPLQAILGASISTLARTFFHCQNALETQLNAEPIDPSRLAELQPLLDVSLRYGKQLHLFADLQHRIGAASEIDRIPQLP